MKRFLALASLCIVWFSSDLSAAVVTGKVMFANKRGRPVANETLVWLDLAPGARVAKRPASAFTVTTRGKTILPHVVAVPAGSTISFPNEDPIAHNLFSLTQGNTFDLGLYRKGPGKSQKFETPGVVNVYCNVHPNMSAVVHVMSAPYYGFADANGNYSFDVPPGKYVVNAWNEQAGSVAAPIEVRNDAAPQGLPLLTIDGRNFRATTAHTNKHGQPYRAPREY